jgi:hypothetical protein
MNVKPLRDSWQRFLDDARQHLAHPDALVHLAVVGLLQMVTSENWSVVSFINGTLKTSTCKRWLKGE